MKTVPKISNKFNEILSLIIVAEFLVFLGINSIINSLREVMLGAEGLKNVVAIILLKLLMGILFALPVSIGGIRYFILIKDSVRTFFRIGALCVAIFISVAFFLLGNDSLLNEQRYIKNYNSDFKILSDCIYDLSNDDYETYTINNVYIDSSQYSHSYGGEGYHNEFTASFYNGNKKVLESQVGADECEYINNLPVGFDTEITVYKKSGFLRSIEPSVSFDKDESYAHFFTISVSGNDIIYEKNVDRKFKNLKWCGFKKGQHDNIENALCSIAITEERPDFYTDLLGKCYDEVCIYGCTDKGYKRLSNILTVKDLK